MSDIAPFPAPQVFALLVLPQTPMLAIAAVIEPLREANAVLERRAYAWRLLATAAAGGVPLADGSQPAYAGSTPDAAGADALIVLAGPWQDWMDSRAMMRPLRRVAPQIDCLGAVSGGVRVLAATGLLDTQKVACAPEAAAELIAAHPAVGLTDAPWASAERRMTAATPLGGTGMLLQMLRARHGAELADAVAARLGWPAPATAPAAAAGPGGDPRVAAAIAQMRASIAAPQSAAAIAQSLGISPRRLEGLFRAELGTGPGAYALDLRLPAARGRIEAGTEPLAAVARATGFSSAGTLARAFRSRYGISPSALRREADSRTLPQG